MRFSEAPKSETIQFRVTSEERDYLTGKAAELGTTVAGLLRTALDAWLTSQPALRGKSDSGSSATPSGVSAKVKAPSKRRPSNSKGRTQ